MPPTSITDEVEEQLESVLPKRDPLYDDSFESFGADIRDDDDVLVDDGVPQQSEADIIAQDGDFVGLSHRLNACKDFGQLEEIVLDESHCFTPEDLKTAFQVLFRLCPAREMTLSINGDMTDAAFDILSKHPTPLSLLSPMRPEEMEDFRSVGAVLLAYALDFLEQLKMGHIAATLHAMGMIGLLVEDDIIHDLVQHAESMLDDPSAEDQDLVNYVVGLAMINYQSDENSLAQLKKCVEALESRCDNDKKGALRWSLKRIGRDCDAQKDGRKVTNKTSSNSSKQKHHGKPGSSTPKKATAATAQDSPKRAQEHREKVKQESKPLLKGLREKHYRDMRMKNMLKRFMNEDDQLVINPDPSEKDRALCEELDRIEAKYEAALRDWRSDANRDEALLQAFEGRLQYGIDKKRWQLDFAQDERAHGIERLEAGNPDYDAEEVVKLELKNFLVVNVLWARFPKNFFEPADKLDPKHGSGTRADKTPWSQYFELWVDGKPTKQRTAGIPWAEQSERQEWFDSFYVNSQNDNPLLKLQLFWKFIDADTEQPHVGGVASLDLDILNLDLNDTDEPQILDIMSIHDESEAPRDASHELTDHRYRWELPCDTEGKAIPKAKVQDKVGTCCIHLTRKHASKSANNFTFQRVTSNSLIPLHEDHVAKCQRLLKKEIKIAKQQMREAEARIEAAQALRWQHIDELQEQRDDLFQSIILHRRVYGRSNSSPPQNRTDPDAQMDVASGDTNNNAKQAPSREKGAAYMKPLPFYSHTSKLTESLSIGIFAPAGTPRSQSSCQRTPRQQKTLEDDGRRQIADGGPSNLISTPAPSAQASHSPRTPLSARSRRHESSSLALQRPPTSGSTRSGKSLGSPSFTFPQYGNAKTRHRTTHAKLDVEVLGDFDAKPPPLTFRRQANIIRSPVGMENTYPGCPVHVLESSAEPAPGHVRHERPWNDSFPSTAKGDAYLKNFQKKAHMLRTEGMLKNFMENRNNAMLKKNSPHKRDLQWDPGPEEMPKDRASRTWRWDTQPIYTYTPYSDPLSPPSNKSTSPVLHWKYKTHIMYADASEISSWPRGSTRPASGAPACFNPRSPGSPARQAATPTATPRAATAVAAATSRGERTPPTATRAASANTSARREHKENPTSRMGVPSRVVTQNVGKGGGGVDVRPSIAPTPAIDLSEARAA